MKVVSRHNSPERWSPEAVARLNDAGVTPWALEIDREYTVFAMMLDRHGLSVLILAGEVRPRPSFVSIELFEISDPALGTDWLFDHGHEPGSTVHALWGYPALVQDAVNFDGLFSTPRVSAHEAFAAAARREDLSDRERAELEGHEAYVKRRALPRRPPGEVLT